MNKTQFFTLSGALLASTALSSTAGAGTIGRFDANQNFTTTPLRIANTIFSTTATDANNIVIGSAAASSGFGMNYANTFSGSTRFTTEFTISGATFVTAGLSTANVRLMTTTLTNTASVVSSISGADACTTTTTLVSLFVARDCRLSNNGAANEPTGGVRGISLTGVTFNNASGLASVGGTISLTGRVLDPADSTSIFEASSTGTIITSAAPIVATVTPGADVTASATTTPTAFTSLSLPTNGSLSVHLAWVRLSSTGALGNGLVTAVSASAAGTTSITVQSSILSSGAVRSVSLLQASVEIGNGGNITNTVANFSGGSITFSLNNTNWINNGTTSLLVSVQFMGTTAIPAAVAGTVSGTVSVENAGGDAGESVQTFAIAGATAAVLQGGFRAEVNTFNASTNGPFGSYLRIHNNGAVAGVVTITLRNDSHTSGSTLGSSFTTAAIQPNSTMQLSALEMEGTGTADGKLPSGGANVPTADRNGSYTVSVTGPIIGYVQHILFDGESVADLSSYRNSGNTTNQP